MAVMSKKTAERVTITGITVTWVVSVIFLIYLMDLAFADHNQTPLKPAAKTGTSSTQQENAGGAASSVASAGINTPTPTPDNGLPFIAGFNTGMSLERVSLWWEGEESNGRTSADVYLRVAVREMCALEAELENYTPPADADVLKFRTTYNGSTEQLFSIYPDNVAEFQGMEGRYFQIPDFLALASAMLPIRGGTMENTVQGQMENSYMMASYAPGGNNRVHVGNENVAEPAKAFFALEKQDADELTELPERTLALVFYYYGVRNYIDVYETGHVKLNSNNKLNIWYTVPKEQLNEFQALFE